MARFTTPPKSITYTRNNLGTLDKVINQVIGKNGKPKSFDELFFYHQSSSFFIIDPRIPNSIRNPLNEAENCWKSNFLTGASGCLRKAIYKLLNHEQIDSKDSAGNFLDFEKRIKLLRNKYPAIESYLFNDLKTVQILTTQELHKNDWQDFDDKTLHQLLEATKDLLLEIYVIPDEKKQKTQRINHLREQANSGKQKDTKK